MAQNNRPIYFVGKPLAAELLARTLDEAGRKDKDRKASRAAASLRERAGLPLPKGNKRRSTRK